MLNSKFYHIWRNSRYNILFKNIISAIKFNTNIFSDFLFVCLAFASISVSAISGRPFPFQYELTNLFLLMWCKKKQVSYCANYEVHMISFQTIFVWAFKIVVESWKFSILLLYILWDDWPIFISASNEQLQQQLEYTLLKPDCQSWGISKMKSDTLEERYAIKLCFSNLEKMPQKRMECFRLLFDHIA